MKSNKFLKLGILFLSLGALVGCGDDPGTDDPSKEEHVCVADTADGWQTNGTKHWYKCTDPSCKKHVNEASHTLGAAEVKTAATCVDAGEKQSVCSICNYVKKETIPATGHTWGETTWTAVADCTNGGTGSHTCSTCQTTEEVTQAALGHDYKSYEGDTTHVPATATCLAAGKHFDKCDRCDDIREVADAQLEHNFQLIGDVQERPEGSDKAVVRVYTCSNGCGQTSFGFKANEVTQRSLSKLVINDQGGARFWGRPIGNDVVLSDDGSPDENAHEAIFNRETLGDFFEYEFDLTAAQVAAMGDTQRLYCEATSAAGSYMDQNNMDFWACKPGDTDWTRGMYIEDTDTHKAGDEIDTYRYILYVDDRPVDFDPTISVPAQNERNKVNYVLPYDFHLHEGVNKIRLVMAGGYRSVFYNFTFRPYEAPVEHVHNFVAGDKIGSSALRELVCECEEKGGYELQAADLTSGQKNPDTTKSNSRLGKEDIDTDVWNISGIPAGKYDVYLEAAHNTGNNACWNAAQTIIEGGQVSENGGVEGSKLYRFVINVDEEEAINVGHETEKYSDFGLSTKRAWTTKPVANLEIGSGASTLTLKNNKNGYSMYIFGLRLVKVGDVVEEHVHAFGADVDVPAGDGTVAYKKAVCSCGLTKITIDAGSDLNEKLTRFGKLSKPYDGTQIAKYVFESDVAFDGKLYAYGGVDGSGTDKNWEKSFYSGKDKTRTEAGKTNTEFTFNTEALTVSTASYGATGIKTMINKDDLKTDGDGQNIGLIEIGDVSVIKGTNTLQFAACDSYGIVYADLVFIGMPSVAYKLYKSSTKCNTYVHSSGAIAQSGDTYFAVGEDFTLIFWTWTYGPGTEEINVKIDASAISIDGNTLTVAANTTPLAQLDITENRNEWQHCGNNRALTFELEEISNIPEEFTHVDSWFTVAE